MISVVGEKKISDKQRNFIRSLAAERDWMNHLDGQYCRVVKLAIRAQDPPAPNDPVNNVPLKLASDTISALLSPAVPKITTTATAAPSTYDQFKELIATVPDSKYALWDDNANTWAFFEIKTSKGSGKKWLYKLTGAPGGWNKKFLGTNPDAMKIVKAIAYNPWLAAQDFTMKHGICAACGAKLSVGQSIAQGFGPICIKKFKPFM